ncbi:MAG: glycosyltransferase family 39 protein [Deltaproteobacteria bacterium]|nr:glycosyltransferase family 39 protein [Deltaproteobacteria bacterium]
MTQIVKLLRSDRFVLLSILLIGLAIRSFSWWYQGGYKGNDACEFETMAQTILQGNWGLYFKANRPHQPVYGLLLSPAYLLHIRLAVYVFVLHTMLSLGTIYLVYKTTREFLDPKCGKIAAFLVAVNLMMAYWFPWTSGDIPFHFFLAWFAFCTVSAWVNPRPASVFLFFVSGLICTLTRPEGFFVVVVAFLILLFRILSIRGLSLQKNALVLICLVFFGASTAAATLTYHKQVREAFFSNIHVAYALYISTRMSTNSPAEQSAAYDSRGHVIERAQSRPGFISPNYALSMEGMSFIREKPVTWLKMYFLRLTSIIFPSLYCPWCSVKNNIYSFTLSFILFAGSVLAVVLKSERRFQATGITIMGMTLAMAISLFQRELDYRVPLSIHILFSIVAPFGWFQLYSMIRRNGHETSK